MKCLAGPLAAFAGFAASQRLVVQCRANFCATRDSARQEREGQAASHMATAHAARCDLQSALMLVLDVRCLRKCPLYMDTANAQHHSSTGMIVMLHVRTLSKRESMKHVHETSEACMLPMEAAPAACRGSCRWNMSSQRPDRSAGKRKTRIVSAEQPLRQKISQHCLTTLSLPSVVTAASSHNVRTKSCRSWCLEKCP